MTTLARKQAPGPKGFELLKTLLFLRNEPFIGLRNLHQKYGDVVGVHWPFSAHLISHPDHLKHIFKDNAKNYMIRGKEFDEVKPLLGEGILLAKGEPWVRQRRTISKEFHLGTVIGFADPINEQVSRWIEEWKKAPPKTVKNIPQEMMSLTLRIAGEIFFGTIIEESGAVAQSVEVNGKLAAERIRAIVKIPRGCPLPSHRKANRLVKEMDQIVYRIIREYQDKRPNKVNVLSRLMTANEKGGPDALSDKQLRDELITLLVAGHETTAGALFWTLYELAQNPDVQEKLHLEIRNVLGTTAVPTVEDLEKLRYPKMVLEETLRLYPSFANLSKHVSNDDEIGGYFIPGNSLMNVAGYLTHRHRDFWKDPEKYIPERFTAEATKDRHPYAYVPFGKGPRACLGEHFAMLEAQLILIPLIQNFKFERISPEPIPPRARIAMVPASPMQLSVTRRPS
jgi:cytochrome P450